MSKAVVREVVRERGISVQEYYMGVKVSVEVESKQRDEWYESKGAFGGREGDAENGEIYNSSNALGRAG